MTDQKTKKAVDWMVGFNRDWERRLRFGELMFSEHHVWSYDTKIATVFRTTMKVRLNTQKYSVTTSRHQNFVRRVAKEADFEVIEVNGPDTFSSAE